MKSDPLYWDFSLLPRQRCIRAIPDRPPGLHPAISRGLRQPNDCFWGSTRLGTLTGRDVVLSGQERSMQVLGWVGVNG